MTKQEKANDENRIAFLAYQSQAMDELHLAHLHARELCTTEEEQERMAQAFQEARDGIWKLVNLVGKSASQKAGSSGFSSEPQAASRKPDFSAEPAP